jgi:hypothetical protein
MAYNPGSNVYVGTDNISSMIAVNVNGNIITVLGNEYVLPSPVQYKLQTTLPNTLIYVINSVGGMISQAVQITVSMNSSEVTTALVTLINYYYLTGSNTFAATSVTVNNGSMTAQLDTAGIDTSTYSGQFFTLNGNVLEGQTVLTGTPLTSTQTSASA